MLFGKPLSIYWLDCLFVSNLKWIFLLGDRSKCWLSESVIRVLDIVYPFLSLGSIGLSLAFD